MNAPLNINPVPAFAGGAVTMVHGKARAFRFQVRDRGTLLPADVSGWSSFRFMAKNHILDSDAAAVLNKTLGSGITTIQAASGLLEIRILAADTSSLTDIETRLFAEIQGLDGSGRLWCLWQGELDIQPTIIQAGS